MSEASDQSQLTFKTDSDRMEIKYSNYLGYIRCQKVFRSRRQWRRVFTLTINQSVDQLKYNDSTTLRSIIARIRSAQPSGEATDSPNFTLEKTFLAPSKLFQEHQNYISTYAFHFGIQAFFVS
jgi:hypothetical protein